MAAGGTSRVSGPPARRRPHAVARGSRGHEVYEVSKTSAVVRAEASMDSVVRCELGRGAAVMIARRVTVKNGEGKDVDRVLLSRPVEGWTSFRCLARSQQRPPPGCETYRRARVDAVLAADEAAAPTAPRVATPHTEAVGRAVVLGFWGSSHDLVERHTALWVDRGFKTWTHVPSCNDDVDATIAALVAFLTTDDDDDYVLVEPPSPSADEAPSERGGRGAFEVARSRPPPGGRIAVHALSNNGFTFLNAFCERHGSVLATAVFVFDSAPHVPKTRDGALATLFRAQTAKVCQAFGEPPDPQHPIYRPRVEQFYADRENPFGDFADAPEVFVRKDRPTLFVYSHADAVIPDEDVEDFVATFPAENPPATLQFDHVPHIGGLRVRAADYARSVDALLARAYPPPPPAADGAEPLSPSYN